MAAALTFEELFARLVGIDTTSHRSNLPLLNVVAEVLDSAGISASIDADDRGKGNLTAVVGELDDVADSSFAKEGLVLCGHTDAVPAEEPDWNSNPFTLTTLDDRWVGRGTADMKGFIALACERLAFWNAQDLTYPLALLLTHDEEVGSFGAKRFGDSEVAGSFPTAVLIGEPTELRVHRQHKGHLRLTLEIEGRAGHSAYPDRGENAVVRAAYALAALEALAVDLRHHSSPGSEEFGEVPFTVLHPATVHGGKAVNIIADSCTVEIGVRVLPQDDIAPIVERIQRKLEDTLGDRFQLSRGHFSPPMSTPNAAPAYQAAAQAVGQTESTGVHFSSDGGFLSQAGFDCVLFGPGSITTAHRANEFLPRADIEVARTALDNIIHRLCGGTT